MSNMLLALITACIMSSIVGILLGLYLSSVRRKPSVYKLEHLCNDGSKKTEMLISKFLYADFEIALENDYFVIIRIPAYLEDEAINQGQESTYDSLVKAFHRIGKDVIFVSEGVEFFKVVRK